jgi:exodeoxyribonuclease V alpha subunit
MKNQPIHSPGTIIESIRGIVDRVTYHNPDNGWSVLRVLPFDNPQQQETVTVLFLPYGFTKNTVIMLLNM